ncbi:hypothetical protein INR49_031745 [Caranx melampygus]|nr:hypothetical protein INR49_031745 [Caranx melampygus]
MGDTGSEGSKPPSNVNVIPPRCPCGFWGSSKTMNLCSKCFADIQKKQPDNDCAPKASSSSSSSQADIFCNDTNSSISQSLMSMPSTSEDPSPGEMGVTSLPAQDDVSSTDTVFGSLSTPTKRSFESGYVFCMLHRLPEQHECLFDHLGRGRQEAVLKMVKLDRKVGRSCQRIGEECS